MSRGNQRRGKGWQPMLWLFVTALVPLFWNTPSHSQLLAASGSSSAPCTLLGTVLDDTDSHPLSEALVVAEDVRSPQKEFVGAKTGSDGRFRLMVTSASEYRIAVQKQGFLRWSRNFNVDCGSVDIGGLRVTGQAAIVGRVTDAVGNPLAGASVQLSSVEFDGATSSLSVVSNTFTNDLGEYRLFGLQPGTYYVSALYQDFAGLLGLRQRPVRSTDQGVDEVANEDFAVTYYAGTTDLESATVVRLKPHTSASNVDIAVAMGQSSTIRGQVLNVPLKAPTFTIRLGPLRPGSLGVSRGYLLSPGNSTFSFRSIPPGDYVLRADVQVDGRSLTARQEISVNGAPLDNVTLDLRASFSISGRVLLGGKPELPQDVQLSLNGLDRRVRIPIKVDGEGHFHIPDAAPDRYSVVFSGAATNLYLKSVALDSKPLESSAIYISDANHLLNIELSAKAGTIEGVALDRHDQAIRGGVAILVGLGAVDSRRIAVAIDQAGKFTIHSLVPGKYRLGCFSDLTSSSDATWDVQKRVKEQGLEIEVAEMDRQVLVVHAQEMALSAE